MDSHSQKVPDLGLPSPSIQQGTSILASPHSGNQMMPGVTEIPPITQASGVATMPTTPPANPQASLPSEADQALAVPAPTDDTLDDLDQEWVSKAKAIVEKTKIDPYLESKELSKVKADYLKIRYNKQIKVAEDSP